MILRRVRDNEMAIDGGTCKMGFKGNEKRG